MRSPYLCAWTGEGAVNFVDAMVLLLRAGPSYKPDRITIGISEEWARRTLGIKRGEPLEFDGIPLYCVGSKRWRINREAHARGQWCGRAPVIHVTPPVR